MDIKYLSYLTKNSLTDWLTKIYRQQVELVFYLPPKNNLREHNTIYRYIPAVVSDMTNMTPNFTDIQDLKDIISANRNAWLYI